MKGLLLAVFARSLLVLSFLTAPAVAGPNNVISFEDSLLGLSETNLIILRLVSDNLGTYDLQHQDLFFVTKDIATGAEVFRHVGRRQKTRGSDFRSEWPSSLLTNDVLDVLEEYDAAAAAGADLYITPLDGATFTETDLTITYGRGLDFRLDTETILAAMTASINATAENIGDYDRRGLVGVGLDELVADRAYSADRCTVLEAILVRHDPESDPVQLATISCGYEDEEPASIIMVIPKAP